MTETMYQGRELKQFVDFDPYQDECEVRCRKVNILKSRVPHHCYCPLNSSGHEIAAGSMVRHETAIVEGRWQRYYTCLDCIEVWLKHLDGPPDGADIDEWEESQERTWKCPVCRPNAGGLPA